ncbi:hypothetical protein FOC1_g10009296, partial [Fusarium oxysporum f. sp. cubense race 1]
DTLHDAWASAVKAFQSTLSTEEYRKLEAIDCPEKLETELQKSRDSYTSRRVPRLLKRLEPFLLQLNFFTQSINIFVQSKPEIAALVWGSLHVLLQANLSETLSHQITLRHRAHIDNIIETLEYLERHLPRVKSFTDLYVVSGRIEKAVCKLYHELIHFFLEATIFFQRNPVVSAMGSSHSSQPAPVAAASYRIIPLVANISFFGRETEMQMMEKVLLPERDTRLTVFSILGIGGVGKSQLALHFTYRHLNHFNAIFWIPAETSVKIKGAFEEIGTEVGLLEPNGGQGNLEAVAQRTKKWLRNYADSCEDKPFLLIFDNVESMSILEKYLPTGGRGSIIITTRNQNLFQPPVTAWAHLKCFDIEEGKRYLLANIPQGALYGNDADSEHAGKICDTCGGLPLALSQVHRFISALNISLDEANRRVTGLEAFVNVSSELNDLQQTDYYHPTGVPSLWDESLQALNPSCSAIVKSIAFLDPDAMPEGFLRLFSENNNQSGQQARATSSSEYGCLHLHGDLDQKQHIRIFRSVLEIIDDTFPDYDDSDRLVTSWPQCKQVLPHVLRLSILCSPAGSYGPAVLLKLGELLERAAWYLQERGAREEAARLLERALNIAKTGLQLLNDSPENGDRDKDAANATIALDLGELESAITNSLGTLELGRGNFSKAQKLFEDAIARRESMGVIDRETIYMKRNVGVALLSSNSVQPALEIFKESLALVEQKLATSNNPRQFHEDLAFCYGSIAFALIGTGQLDEAWDAAVKSTELLKQSYSLKSPRIGDCHTTLGNIRLLQGNLQEAEIFLHQALDIRVEACGEHEETALAMHNYARILKELGRTKDALLPDSKGILARSLYYLSRYQMGEDPIELSKKNEEQAFQLYYEHRGHVENHSSLQAKDFDDLLIAYNR